MIVLEKPFKIVKDSKLTDFLGGFSLRSLVASFVLILLFYLFFSGKMLAFYASSLFSFYALTQHMWISVMMLGVFQTLILVPLRIFRVRSSHHIKEFQESIESIDESSAQQQKFKQNFHLGNQTFLFYLVDFMVQLLTFLSIGRLFLIDFYAKALNPSLLYTFVPYPHYPILDTIFKIPYLVITETHQFGWRGVLLAWALLLLLQVVVWLIKGYKQKKAQTADYSLLSMPLAGKYGLAYIVATLAFAWILMTHFPVGLDLRIFKGNVSVPNQTLNTVTAIATFSLLLWFSYKDMVRKTSLAYESGVPVAVIKKTRKNMFKQSVQSATLVGLGAYFVTNHIPSAFELSIFTFELIAVFSPLTLDKVILKTVAQKPLEETTAQPKIAITKT